MNKKIIILIIVILIAICGVIGTYFLMQPQYETLETPYFSVNITKGSGNFTANITENNSIRTIEYANGDKQDDNYIRIAIFDANNTGSLYQLAASTAIQKIETDWSSYVMRDDEHNINGKVYKVTNKTTDNVVYVCILKNYESDGVYIILTADNINTLKVMVETFELKSLNKNENKNNNTSSNTNTNSQTKTTKTKETKNQSDWDPLTGKGTPTYKEMKEAANAKGDDNFNYKDYKDNMKDWDPNEEHIG